MKKLSGPQIRVPRRVLITRLSHIGDCILTLPLVCAIKRQQPNTFIAWTVESPSHHLLANHPAIDEMIEVPKGLLKRPARLAQVRQQLQALACDTAVDPQSLSKSAILGWLSGAEHRIGFGGTFGKELAPWLNNDKIHAKSTHLVDRTLELLGPLGLEASTPEFGLMIQPDAHQFVDEFLRRQHLGCDFAIINPGASWSSKRWINKRWGRVARFLGEEHEFPTVVTWAGSSEQQMAHEIVAGSRGRAILAPATTLPQLAALLQRAKFFLGCDTGPLHIASAVGTPCIGLYGPTRPQDSGAYGQRHIAVQAFYQGGSRRVRKTSRIAMNAIDVISVTEACEKMIHQCLANVRGEAEKDAA